MEGGGCGRGGVKVLGTPLGACKTVGMATEYASVVASCAITSTCRAASTWVCWASQESDDDRKWTLVCTVPRNFCTGTTQRPFEIPGIRRNRTNPVPCLPKLRVVLCSICVCVPFIINQTPAAGSGPCHDPRLAAFPGRWAIPSTWPGPQPLLVTYNLSSLALTPGEHTPYVCMYVSMVCGVYVGMCWVRGESTQVHR